MRRRRSWCSHQLEQGEARRSDHFKYFRSGPNKNGNGDCQTDHIVDKQLHHLPYQLQAL
ncbi:hypothetical protein DPMN_045612 [Dreissena polymorpha]|uniref:Uncharacterized protein n=1 Tax=Dreissena polymorpha TaxID=45954 RepID=A0A9D4HZV5_DREPO|nr:hypothetical protein DPMN_045612 [Dreissena polymorpha]